MIEQRGGYVHLKLVQMNLPFGMLSLICSNTFLRLLQNSFLVVPCGGGNRPSEQQEASSGDPPALHCTSAFCLPIYPPVDIRYIS